MSPAGSLAALDTDTASRWRCGEPTAAGGICGQWVTAERACGYHGADKWLSRAGQEAQQRARAAAVYVCLASRKSVQETLQSVARAVANGTLTDKRAGVVVRACAERIKMLDLRLAEREELLEAAAE
jgi:hypothetical protein